MLSDALAALQDPGRWEQVRGDLFAMWTTGVTSRAVHNYAARMGTYGFDMWSRAGREIAADFELHGTPVAALATSKMPTLHVHAQPTDDAFFQAQQEFARENPWFRVQRVPGRSHFPGIEEPVHTASAIASFVKEL